MARGVRQGCPASGFLIAMAFDSIFRWLQDAIIPRNPAGRDLLQPVPCAYADNLAVAASSFRRLMTALAPALQIMDQITGLHLNHRKCCWVQYGSERCEPLLNWLSDICEDFREMQIVTYVKNVGTMTGPEDRVKYVKYAKYVGTMIGPEGYIHRWTAPRKKVHSASPKN